MQQNKVQLYQKNRSIAILFPGQGCQYLGMCNTLIRESAIVNEVFEESNSILNFDLRSLILNGSIEELTLSENAQPAIVTASYALFRHFVAETGLLPFCVVGHSLGEISAFIAAGALSFSEGILYARERGKLMHNAVQRKIGRAGIIVDLDRALAMQLVCEVCADDYITISGYNSPKQFIVAGTESAFLLLKKKVSNCGGELIPFRMMPMKVDAPYHSKLMAFLTPQFENIVKKIKFKEPELSIWSTATNSMVTASDRISEILVKQLTTPIHWSQSLEQMCNLGIELLIDIGPGKIMRNLVQEDLGLLPSFAFDDSEDKIKLFKYVTNINFISSQNLTQNRLEKHISYTFNSSLNQSISVC